MKIYVDADACPVVRIVEDIAKKHGIAVTLLCDTNHVLSSAYSEVKVIGAGADAVDFALINLCKKGDIVVTQDYGVAAMALGKGAYCIHQSGKWYTNDNIDMMLMERHLGKKARRASSKNHLKGPKKRTEEDDIRFAESFEKMVLFASIEKYIDDNYVEENNEILVGDEMFADIVREELEYRRTFRQTENRMSEPMVCSRSTEYMAKDTAEVSITPGKRSLDSLVNNLDETFSEMLLRLIDERGLKDSYVYNKANIDRRHFSKIRNNIDYIPTKKTVIAFAIALKLTMDEAIDLMSRAGYAFSKSSKFDVIICFFLESKSYDIFEINEVLFKYDQPTIGE